ncbi:hypothetical protein J5N97_023535 [Dioscorea zingiberensis]|uniref:Uncharacterized protein n=1 Tax=Dioscorea zingiberensis TaxID=325984 RepID=A0A9D5H7Z4_9LILI|nr:hypothetical protein J5N97_023535 [Dioscorea zingiberensis]
MAAVHEIRILDHSPVSPPKGSVPETTIPLTFFDIFWHFGATVDRVFFYEFRHSTTHFIHHLLPTFKSSLSLTLQHFFPLAGHVRPSPSSPDHFEIHYTDGDSISLIIAESAGDFDQLVGDQPRDFAKLKPLIPSLDSETEELMALQVTLFPNHGLCLGVSIMHVVSDGPSSMNFIKSWAATCLAGGAVAVLSSPPLFDRSSIIVDTENLYHSTLQTAMVMRAKSKQFASNVDLPDDVVWATFSLKKEVIKKLKDMIMARYDHGDRTLFHCSTFVAACAYMWTCLIRSRGWPRERTAHLVFAVDARTRLTPAISPAYFGNCLSFCFVEAKVGDVVDGDDGVCVAAEYVGKAIDELKHGVLRGAEGWWEKFNDLAPLRPLSFAGSPKLGVYDSDFGWGKPVKVEVTSIKGTGAMSIAETGKEEGGLEFGLAFPQPEIDAFEACFTAGIHLLMNK